MSAFNKWFLGLPEKHQKQLVEDKWMLANQAFEAGRAQHLLKWTELSEAQQRAARDRLYGDYLEYALTDTLAVEPGGALDLAIKQAWADAERMQTPWFASHYLHESAGDLLMQMVMTELESTMWVNPASDVNISDYRLPK